MLIRIRTESLNSDPRCNCGSKFKLSVRIWISIIYLVFFIFLEKIKITKKNYADLNLHWKFGSGSALKLWIQIWTFSADLDQDFLFSDFIFWKKKNLLNYADLNPHWKFKSGSALKLWIQIYSNCLLLDFYNSFC